MGAISGTELTISSVAVDLATNKFAEAFDFAQQSFATANNFLTVMSNEVQALHSLAAPSNFDLDEINITQVDFDDIGQAPADFDDSLLPTAPTKPDIVYNSYSFDKELDITLNMPSRPVTPSLDEIPVIVADLISAVEAKLNARLVDGATGLDANVEQAIWDRARSRQELENIKKYQEAENYYASRGFSIPPGALSGRLNELLIEFARNDSYLNNDIMIQQAKMALDNENAMLQIGSKYILDRLIQTSNEVIEKNKLKIQAFLGELDAYKTDIQAEVSRIDNLTKIFLGELEAFKAKTSVEVSRVESLTRVYLSELESYRTESDVLVKVYLGKLEIYKGKIEAAAAKADTIIKTLDLQLRQVLGAAEVEYKEAYINAENLKNTLALDVELIKGGAQIATQLTASALSSVNASATVGAGQSENASLSESYNNSNNTNASNSTSHNYNYNASV